MNMNKSGYSLMILLVSFFLAGCEYEMPLVEEPQIEMDERLVGLWTHTDTHGRESSLVLVPLQPNELFVAYPEGAETTLYARSTLWEKDDLRVVQLKWFGTSKGTVAEDHVVYQYGTYTLEGDTLTFRLINPAVVPQNMDTRADLIEAMIDNQDHPELLRSPMVFTRLSPN